MPFDSPELFETLHTMPTLELDALPFGVIGFDREGIIQRYNTHESTMAKFEVGAVLGQHLFIELAPCLNNYLVAGRFEDADAQGEALDEVMLYVLSFRMRPTRVSMRLIARPGAPLRFVLVQRHTGAAS
ncbi:MAG: hypothetical protein RJB60_1739 [Pseudomonadota bacterium]|jgi:photoactive yellow protein